MSTRWSGAEEPTAVGGPGREAGSVAAEFALALPAVLLVLAALLAAGRVVLVQVQCQDAARAAARVAARGEGADVVRGTALAAAPDGAGVSVTTSAQGVRVEVRATVPLAGGLGGDLRAAGSATASVEGVS